MEDTTMTTYSERPLTKMPEEIAFDVSFEPTRFDMSKYVINNNTDEVIGIVGKDFKCASHIDFYRQVRDTVVAELSDHDLTDATLTWRTARNNAWTMMDMRLPNVTHKIATSKHETDVAQRIIALHGVDGSCSNITLFGAIDFYCTNGMVTGEYNTIKRKNTSGFSLESFIDELYRAKEDFTQQMGILQKWADTTLTYVNVKEVLEKMIKSDRKAEKMLKLYNQERITRGANVFALYSALTNYSSYADERNGFALRNTGYDTASESMWKRENEVSQWISSPIFKELVA